MALANGDPAFRSRFGLADLLQLITICAGLAALVKQTGVLPAIFLACFATALMLKRGPLAILALAATCLLMTSEQDRIESVTAWHAYYITTLALGIGAWFRLKLW
jgi:hypothetical protein